MNPPTITYKSALCAVLMEEEETSIRNMRIVPRESVNSSSTPPPRRSTFCQRKPLISELSTFSKPRQSARILQQRQSRLVPKPAQKTPYTPKKNRRGQRILCLSPMGAAFERWRTIR